MVKVSHLLNYTDTCKLNKPGTYTHICTHGHTPVNIMVTQRVKGGPVYKQGLRSLEGRRMRCPAPQELVLSLLSAQSRKKKALSRAVSSVSLAQVVVLQEDQTRW